MTQERTLAPIVLFAFNRADHLKTTLEHIKKAELSAQTDIIIFSDAARSYKGRSEADKVAKVRELIHSIDIGKSKLIIEADQNKGLSSSIMEGLNYVFERYENAIVLEDDVLLAPKALVYFNRAFDHYVAEEQVMHIAGFHYGMEVSKETYFMKVSPCWGWGTWKSSWQNMIADPTEIMVQLFKKGMYTAVSEYPHFILPAVLENIDKKSDTWAGRWNASMILAGGLSFHSNKSLTYNIGLDGSGENADVKEEKVVPTFFDNMAFEKQPIEEDQEALSSLEKLGFYRPEKQIHWLKLLLRKSFLSLIQNGGLSFSISLAKLESKPRFMPGEIVYRGHNWHVLDKKYLLAEIQNNILDNRLLFVKETSSNLVIDALPFEGITAFKLTKDYNKEVILVPQNKSYLSILKKNFGSSKSLKNISIEVNKSLSDILFSVNKEVCLLRVEVSFELLSDLKNLLESYKVQHFEFLIRGSKDISGLMKDLMNILDQYKYTARILGYGLMDSNEAYINAKRGYTICSVIASKS